MKCFSWNIIIATLIASPLSCCQAFSLSNTSTSRRKSYTTSTTRSGFNYQHNISPTSSFDNLSQSSSISTSSIRKERTKLQAIIDLDFDDEEDPETIVPKVYPQRWVQLGYLSLLALVSDWVCFSTAAAPSTFETAFGHSSAGLIDLFLFTNVFSCFLVTDIVAKVGLGKAIKGASVLMGLGCLLRSGIPLFMNDGLVPYEVLVAGTLMVGAAQPFFQCTPPMLSATWFASDERATSTATAINFNQIGIATAFLVGGNMATDSVGLQHYFELITVLSGVLAAGTVLQFQDKPPTPPSSSEIEKMLKGEEEPPFFESVKKFFKTPGFTKPLIAFICSISITNIVGAFIDEVLERGGIVDQFQIDLAGAGFELAILIGGIVIGGYVDRTKKYKKVTLACLLATVFFVVPLGLTDHALGQEPILLVLSLLGLGMAAGPVQPINAELAVDVTYPSDETAVESVQQIGGNLISALLVPVAELMSKQDYQLLSFNTLLASDIRGDVVLLTLIALVTMVYYSGFDAPLKRTIADCSDDGVCSAPELNMKMNANGDLILDANNKSVNGSDNADSVVSVDIAKSLREATKKVQEEVKADK